MFVLAQGVMDRCYDIESSEGALNVCISIMVKKLLQFICGGVGGTASHLEAS